MAGFEWDRPGAYLGALPAAFGLHYKAVAPPIFHVRAFTVKHIAKGSVAAVTGTAEHGVFAVDFTGKHDPIAVVGQKGILNLCEGFKIVGVTDANGGAMVAITPGDNITVIDPTNARVVAVFQAVHFRVLTLELDRLRVDLPGNAI